MCRTERFVSASTVYLKLKDEIKVIFTFVSSLFYFSSEKSNATVSIVPEMMIGSTSN